mmetsp:Transcript_61204/g.165118  ORF Transcript_61204/g.165118 Transcript_61204/m.165118 type:complete len:207 (+) Transcript_61204:891-1511(+)
MAPSGQPRLIMVPITPRVLLLQNSSMYGTTTALRPAVGSPRSVCKATSSRKPNGPLHASCRSTSGKDRATHARKVRVRPKESAIRPNTADPTTLENTLPEDSQATCVLLTPYSSITEALMYGIIPPPTEGIRLISRQAEASAQWMRRGPRFSMTFSKLSWSFRSPSGSYEIAVRFFRIDGSSTPAAFSLRIARYGLLIHLGVQRSH